MTWANIINHVDKNKLPWAKASATHTDNIKKFENHDEFEKALEKLEEDKKKNE